MLLALAVALLGALVTGPGPAQAASPAAVVSRAMWVWDTPEPEQLVAFAVAHGVDEIFLSVPVRATSSLQLPRLRASITQAHAAGIRVSALGGDPGWIDDPSWAVTNWLTPALAVGGFDGVHLDVEPHGHPAWQSDRAGTVSRYLDMLSVLVTKAGRGRHVEADIAFWYDQVPVGRSTLDAAVLSRVSGVSVMAYRNTAAGPDGTLELAAPALRAAAAARKRARVGQETTYLGDEPYQRKQTFHGQSTAQLETQAAAIDGALRGTAGYGGLAFHSYAGWAALRP